MRSDNLQVPIREDDARRTQQLGRDPDQVPHPIVAIAIALAVVIAATLLLFVSGHIPRHPGATLVTVVAVPVLAVLGVLLARKWRRAAH